MIKKYYNFLHGKWPTGKVEKLPYVDNDGNSSVKGIKVVGDLSGVPLLKFSSESGARAVHDIEQKNDNEILDLAIIGGGVSGISSALEAEKKKLKYELYESNETFFTIKNFPKKKPIYTYPLEMTPRGGIQYNDKKTDIKEGLLESLKEQISDKNLNIITSMVENIEKKADHFIIHHKEKKITKASNVIIAIGRSGNFRKLNVPGEDLDKVSNRLHDPSSFSGKNVAVIGGGDSAVESAIALAENNAKVNFIYRGKELNRPKPENVEKINKLAKNSKNLTLNLGTNPTKITENKLYFKADKEKNIANDFVFSLIGREAPLDFFRRSKIKVTGDKGTNWWIGLILMLLFCIWIYHWKSGKLAEEIFFNINPAKLWTSISPAPGSFLETLKISMSSRSFYYTLIYCTLIIIFGLKRIKRRKTPYVKAQTLSLMAFQFLPLFLLPEIILPYLGHNGLFSQDGTLLKNTADALFPQVSYDHGREYWRAYGFILAWPLFIYNWFTNEPMKLWLIIGFIQTFVIIPLLIRKWGKGAYCGWICSCGALAETMGDTHRHKMPHGPTVNKFNMIGQVFLVFAFILLGLRLIGWIFPQSFIVSTFNLFFEKLPVLNYKYFVDLIWAGVIGVSFYFHYSGRIWCRFACPLAALMHIYTRLFSKFAIFPDKKKCISCNVCTSVCHQGIDIMNFANKGLPMQDVECVRCSACVQQCPTEVLNFGRFDNKNNIILDKLPAYVPKK